MENIELTIHLETIATHLGTIVKKLEDVLSKLGEVEGKVDKVMSGTAENHTKTHDLLARLAHLKDVSTPAKIE